MKRNICVITGTRADYGILYPVMKAIKQAPGLELSVIVIGMHLMKEFGRTIKEIKRAKLKIAQTIDVSFTADTGKAMGEYVGKAIVAFAGAFAKIKPDIVLVLGDRGEMLAAAIAANYLNIPVAHIHGGELSGHVDGVVRHAITKLAQFHFPATAKAGKRIIRMGETPGRVFVVGAPALDSIMNNKITRQEQLKKKYMFRANEPLLLLVQHPVSTEVDRAGEQIRSTLEAIVKLKLPTIVIYPNADAGGRRMIAVIKAYKKYPFLKIFKSVPHEDYLGLLKIASVLIGNSSSGLIEAPSFGLPVVNIGSRQSGRERGINVADVVYNRTTISRAIKKALYDKKYRKTIARARNPYGRGQASVKIVRTLKAIKFDSKLMRKQLAY